MLNAQGQTSPPRTHVAGRKLRASAHHRLEGDSAVLVDGQGISLR
jgi:hypothetical protein